MPHEQLNSKQVANYLHMDRREVEKLASRGKLPARKVGGEFRFIKSELDHWVELQMHKLSQESFEKIEKGVASHHGLNHREFSLCEMIPPGGIVVPLGAKTKQAVIRRLVDVADQQGIVYDRDFLIQEVTCREELCSTALMAGAAIPHPRSPLEYDIERSFVVVGLTSSGIPFGAEDGTLTRLFFLICCKDERTHLHVLSRLARLLHAPGALELMLDVQNSNELIEILTQTEQAVLEKEN